MSAVTILAILFTVAVILLAGTMRRYLHQAAQLDAAHAEIIRCRETHLGELDAVVRDTQPPGPPPMDAVVRPLFPTNPPYRRRSTRCD